MRSDTQQAGRRRRGGRRHRSQGGRRYENGAQASPKSTPAKTGFFARLIAFFTGSKAKPAPRPSSRPAEAAKATSTAGTAAAESAQPKGLRKPELVEVTSPKVYVGNLSFDAAESDLFDLFAGVGSVQNAEIVSHRDTQKSKGFGFVTMTSVDEAKRAVGELHDKEFMGRRLVVSGAKTSDVRDAR
jgi:hypothetical protein